LKKPISLIFLIAALLLAAGWTRLVGSQSGALPPCTGYPAPAPYPVPYPCRNANPPPPGLCLSWITRGPYRASDSPLYFYPPEGELICRVYFLEFDDKSFDFPVNACFFEGTDAERCVSGMFTNLWTKVEFPVDLKQVTVYTMRRPEAFLPAVVR
jgi:hypothetical protein